MNNDKIMKPYKSPLRIAKAEFVERKSRFISNIAPASTEEEARAFLEAIKKEHPEANHNVYAYFIRDGNICRHSDDGEPSGTAGKPLLDVFIKQSVFDFCCVATRYFGGIPLGAGGLIRAYSRCGVIGLEASEIGIICEFTLCRIALPYTLYEMVKRLLVSHKVDIIAEDFGADVNIQFSLPSELLPQLENALTELTQGTICVSIEGTQMGRKKEETE